MGTGKPCVRRSDTPLIGHLAPLAAAFHDSKRAQRSLRAGPASGKFGLQKPQSRFDRRARSRWSLGRGPHRCSVTVPEERSSIGRIATRPRALIPQVEGLVALHRRLSQSAAKQPPDPPDGSRRQGPRRGPQRLWGNRSMRSFAGLANEPPRPRAGASETTGTTPPARPQRPRKGARTGRSTAPITRRQRPPRHALNCTQDTPSTAPKTRPQRHPRHALNGTQDTPSTPSTTPPQRHARHAPDARPRGPLSGTRGMPSKTHDTARTTPTTTASTAPHRTPETTPETQPARVP